MPRNGLGEHPLGGAAGDDCRMQRHRRRGCQSRLSQVACMLAAARSDVDLLGTVTCGKDGTVQMRLQLQTACARGIRRSVRPGMHTSERGCQSRSWFRRIVAAAACGGNTMAIGSHAGTRQSERRCACCRRYAELCARRLVET